MPRNTLKDIKICKIVSFTKIYNSILFVKLAPSNCKIVGLTYKAINILIFYYYYRYTGIYRWTPPMHASTSGRQTVAPGAVAPFRLNSRSGGLLTDFCRTLVL